MALPALLPVDVLVHNVSHCDMVIALKPDHFRPKTASMQYLHRVQENRKGGDAPRDREFLPQHIFMKPKFSTFHHATEKLLEVIEKRVAKRCKLDSAFCTMQGEPGNPVVAGLDLSGAETNDADIILAGVTFGAGANFTMPGRVPIREAAMGIIRPR